MVTHWLAELDGRRATVEVPASVGQPRCRVRLPRGCAGAHEQDHARGAQLEPRPDRAHGRRRGQRRADRGPREPLRAGRRGGDARSARRAARWRRLAGGDAQRDPAGAGARVVRGGHGRRVDCRQCAPRRAARLARRAAARRRDRGSSRTTPPPRCSAGSSCRLRPTGASRPCASTRRETCARSSSCRSCACPRSRCATCSPTSCHGPTPWPTSPRSRPASPGWPTRRYDLLRLLTVDRLHEPYRAALYPALPRLVEAALEAGALGASLSGAGSAVIAFSDALATISQIEAGFLAVAADMDLPGRVLVLAPRNAGATVVSTG